MRVGLSSGSSIYETLFDFGDKQARLAELSELMNAPAFWNDQDKAQGVIQQVKELKGVLDPFESLGRQADDLETMIELAEESGDSSFDEELREATARATADFEAFELRSMLSGSNDHCNAYITIHAGAGGTEACDWAEMLLRMYMMWAESHRYK